NTTSTDEDAEEAAAQALSSVESEIGRTTDPVRMYMREMGTVELLTREGEIDIAKRIEDGIQPGFNCFRFAEFTRKPFFTLYFFCFLELVFLRFFSRFF
ncbi:RNA polymerase sigma factor RpoD, partial [Salmonella enterica subsp. enterica serovar Anatum str. USDA 100]